MKRIKTLLVLSTAMLLIGCNSTNTENTSKDEPTTTTSTNTEPTTVENKDIELDKAAIQQLIKEIPENIDLDYVSARQTINSKDYEAKALFYGYENEFMTANGNPVEYYCDEETTVNINTKHSDNVVEQYMGYTDIYLDDVNTPYEQYESVNLIYLTEDETWGDIFNMKTVYLTEGYEESNYDMGIPSEYIEMFTGYSTFDAFLADCYYGYSHDSVESFFGKDGKNGYTTSVEGVLHEDGSWEATYSYETTMLYSDFSNLEEEEISELAFNPGVKEICSYTTKFENGACVYAKVCDTFFVTSSYVDGAAFTEPQLLYEQSLVTDQMTKEAGSYDGDIELTTCDLSWLFE